MQLQHLCDHIDFNEVGQIHIGSGIVRLLKSVHNSYIVTCRLMHTFHEARNHNIGHMKMWYYEDMQPCCVTMGLKFNISDGYKQGSNEWFVDRADVCFPKIQSCA